MCTKFLVILGIICLLITPVLAQVSPGGGGTDNPTYVYSLVVNNEYTLPTTDGANGESLTTDGAGAVTWASSSGTGDMTKAVYDPLNVAADAFDMDNMTEGLTNLILVAAERADIISNTSARHNAVTVTDGTTIDLTLTGQDITAELVNTTVTPGSYTATDLTVDADGRITAAASGSGGGGLAIGDTVTSGTAGSVLFVDSSTQLAQDNSNLFWDETNDILKVGTTDFRTIAADLYIRPTGTQIFIGTTAGGSVQSGALQNVGIGASSLASLVGGDYNTMIGWGTGAALTSGSFNTCIGRGSCNSLQDAGSNVVIGQNSLYTNIAGDNNVAIGADTLNTAIGDNNVAIGKQVGSNITSASNVVGIGNSSAQGLTTHSETVAIGAFSMNKHTGSNNVFVGGYSGYGGGTAGTITGNVMIGRATGYYLTAGSDYNTILGFAAGQNLTGPTDYNIIIGGGISAHSTTASNQLNIGNLLFSEGITGRGTNVSTGGLGIGVISPDTRLDVDGAITQRELSADPSDPDEGSSVTWQSDGTGSGDDGDIMVKITTGGTTKTTTLIDFSAL